MSSTPYMTSNFMVPPPHNGIKTAFMEPWRLNPGKKNSRDDGTEDKPSHRSKRRISEKSRHPPINFDEKKAKLAALLIEFKSRYCKTGMPGQYPIITKPGKFVK